MTSRKVYIYGWQKTPNCIESDAADSGAAKSILILGAEDCAVIEPILESSDIGKIDIYRRYSNERGAIERCFDEHGRECIVSASSSKNIVVYSDDLNSLWSYGLNMMDRLAVQSPEISNSVMFHSDQNNKTIRKDKDSQADATDSKKPKLPYNTGNFHDITQQKHVSTKNVLEKTENITETDSDIDVYKRLRHTLIAKRFLVKQIAAGDSHCLILDSSNFLYSFGTGANGELGLGKIVPFTKTLQKVDILNNDKKIKKVKFIAAGSYYSAVITEEGCLYTFGCGAYYRLGHGSDENVLLPKRVRALDGVGLLLPNGTSTGENVKRIMRIRVLCSHNIKV